MSSRISRRKLAQFVVDASTSQQAIGVAIKELAAYLIDSRRLREIDLVVRAIEDEFAVRGTVVARVSSARPLTDSLRESIVKRLAAPKVQLVEVVNEDLIGGVRIETPDKLLDATIKRKLLALSQAKM